MAGSNAVTNAACLRRKSDAFAKDEGAFDEDDSSLQETDTTEVDIVVAQIRRLTRLASLEFALRVGAVIIHYFYQGDTHAWRLRGPKTSSFRRLAEHPLLPLSAGALYRCVALYELCDRLDAPSRWEKLGASHLRVVLGLPGAVQERLLATANAQEWTVKKLHEHVLLHKPESPMRGGRRVQPLITRRLVSMRKCLDGHRDFVGRVSSMSWQELERSIGLLEETRRCLDFLENALQAARNSYPPDVASHADEPHVPPQDDGDGAGGTNRGFEQAAVRGSAI